MVARCAAAPLCGFLSTGRDLTKVCAADQRLHGSCCARRAAYAGAVTNTARRHLCGALGHAGEAADADIRIWACSDIHTDYEPNLQWVKSLARRGFSDSDVLLLAGDVSEDIRVLQRTLTCLRDIFGKVFFLPGNHELWLRGGTDAPGNGGARDSYKKLQLIFQLCTDLGVNTRPERLGNVWVVPLQSWHHASFDREPEVPGMSAAALLAVSDYAACSWPVWMTGASTPGSLQLAEWFDSLNDGIWEESLRGGTDVISMSHFLPYQELLPEKRFLYFPHLAKVAGSEPLAARVKSLRPHIHVFGHTHFAWNMPLNGTRYIQAPLAYPAERRRRLPSLSLGPTGDAATAASAPPPWLPALIYTSGAAGAPLGVEGRAAASGNGSEVADEGAANSGTAAARLDSSQKLRHGYICGEALQAHWSEYYKSNPRDPSNITAAPWVEKALQRRRQQRSRG